MEIVKRVEIRDGVGYIAGRNVKAEMVARLHVMEKVSVEDVAEQYDLSIADVYAAIAFYYDNQDELDAAYAQAIERARQVGTSFEEFKATIAARQQDKTG